MRIKTVGVIISLILISLQFSSENLSPQQPPAFELIQTEKGIKFYSNSQGDYIQIIDLSQNAQVLFLQGEQVGDGVPAAYSGINPQFQRQSISDFWQDLTQQFGNRAFSVCNGQFFKGGNPTELAFPVQTGGQLVSSGYAGVEEFPQEKLIFGIQNQTAEIIPFSEQTNYQQTQFPYTEAIVGIREDAAIAPIQWYSKDPFIERPRTFLGVADQDLDQQNETVLILTSKGQTQSNAAQMLKEFGANQVMMLDGGGSTQLIVQGTEPLSSTDPTPRLIPQAIGILVGAHCMRPQDCLLTPLIEPI